MNQLAHRAGIYLWFLYSMKQLVVYRMVTPSINVLHLGGERHCGSQSMSPAKAWIQTAWFGGKHANHEANAPQQGYTQGYSQFSLMLICFMPMWIGYTQRLKGHYRGNFDIQGAF